MCHVYEYNAVLIMSSHTPLGQCIAMRQPLKRLTGSSFPPHLGPTLLALMSKPIPFLTTREHIFLPSLNTYFVQPSNCSCPHLSDIPPKLKLQCSIPALISDLASQQLPPEPNTTKTITTGTSYHQTHHHQTKTMYYQNHYHRNQTTTTFRVKEHCTHRGLPWGASLVSSVCSEQEYYEELMKLYRTWMRVRGNARRVWSA